MERKFDLNMNLPILETARLRVRPLEPDDVEAVHRLYLEIGWADPTLGEDESRRLRREWVEWSTRNYVQLSRLHQPPYGERVVEAKSDGEFVGLVGLVPLLVPIKQLESQGSINRARFSAEVGLFWATAPALQRQGYATEAGMLLIKYAFEVLRVDRVVACTEYDNAGSIGVMRRLGMRIERNVYADPPWFQVCGIAECSEN
jgi:RimJ/RimL family protein N-acetyltransferase